MTNGPKYDILHHHFSADEFYLLPIMIVASGVHLIILFLTIWSAIVLKARQLFHATYKMFLILVLLHVSMGVLTRPATMLNSFLTARS
jgi:uncharacterized membrane protein YhaH (DUF805 family)